MKKKKKETVGSS